MHNDNFSITEFLQVLWLLLILFLGVLLLESLASRRHNTPTGATASATYFEGTVKVESHRTGTFSDDYYTIVFTQPGEYLVAFAPMDSSNSGPGAIDVTVEESQLPLVKTVTWYTIYNSNVIVTHNGVTEIHSVIFP